MKTMMKLMGRQTCWVVVFFAMLAAGGKADGQATWNQNTACPGWNNPSSFTAGNAQNYYRGQGGRISSRSTSQCPDVLTGRTGTSWSNTIYTGAQMNTLGSGCSNPSQYGSVSPNKDMRPYAIMNVTDQAPGHPVNRDPNTGDNLPFVPTHFNTSDNSGRIVNTNLTKSIRIGDICANGGETGAQALYYHIFPTTDNAMLFIYYAIVVESPTHDVEDNPWFIIRVTKQNANGQFAMSDLENNQLTDTLAYYVGSTPDDRGGTVHIENDLSINGWHKYGSGGTQGRMQNNYKDWTKVAINLSNYLYQPLRVEVIIMDCTANYHFAYAYIAGECREMTIKTSGCPAGLDSSVTTLSAPRGMLRYEWAVSEYGKSDPVTRLDPGGEDEYFTFRPCRMDDGTQAAGPEDSVIFRNGVPDTVHYCDYDVRARDFRVDYRPSSNPAQRVALTDSMGNRQTFRCRMTSALDPAKPFKTSLYISVQNQKPSMSIKEAYDCDGNVKVWNQSYVPGDPTLVEVRNSTWNYYTDPTCSGTPIYTSTGASIENDFPDTTTRYLLLRTVTDDPECYSEGIYKIKPLGKPNPQMTISNRVLCDADQTTLTDVTEGDVYYREWTFLGDEPGTLDTLRGEEGNSGASRVVRRAFGHSIEPIRLRVLNGMHYENEDGETVWCEATAIDTVAVFVHPELQVEGDTIVCQGGRTDATVRALGVDGCTYEWSLTDGTVTGDIPPGDRLQVEPYADVSTYYVRVTSPQGCVAWSSINAYYVRPLLVKYPEAPVCPGDTVMLIGRNADHYRWSASPADASLYGQEDSDTIRVTPEVTTVYTMAGYGSNNCEATPLTETVSVVPMPVPAVNLDPAYIDTENPTLTLTDVSQGGSSSVWLFEDGSMVTGREVQHTFEGIDHDTATRVVLTTANEIGCSVEYPFTVPVKMYTAWFPTVFTPGSEDDNDKFRLYTINTYDYFHISIFDRRGALVFESNDPAFAWDGFYKDTPCKQGVYVYVCSYRKPEAGTISTRQGTITLVR